MRGLARSWMLPALALVLWTTWLVRCAAILLDFSRRVPRVDVWLYDWNAYYAAARQLIDHTLYTIELSLPGEALPIGVFNYPPLAAAWAVPLLPLGREPGGITWLIVGVLATSTAAVLGSRALDLSWSRTFDVSGLALGAYAMMHFIASDIVLGNNSHLVFALIAAFALAHVRGHERVAGTLLALAVGTKIWPVALVILILRERRWSELRWAVGSLVIQAVATLAWLGLDVIDPIVPAVLGQNAFGNTGTVPVIWTSWARVAWDWWPAWGSYAVATALLLLPSTGRLGLGLGIIAGLSLNTHLWHHYTPVFVFGVALAMAGALRRVNIPREHIKPPGQLHGAA